MSFVASQRIQARCTKCKDITGHIVVVVVDNMPIKVECCACKSVHKYYPPAGTKVKKQEGATTLKVGANQQRETAVKNAAKKNALANTRTTNIVLSQTAVKKTVKKAEDLEQEWKKCLANSVAAPKDYSITITLSEGDIVNHVSFGVGFVQEIIASDKAQILFQEGIKTLKCTTA